MEGGLFHSNKEAVQPSNSDHKRGGWITFPFITATLAGLTLGSQGWKSNLIVYMTGVFKLRNIDAVQLWSVESGCTSMFSVIGAIVADSFLGFFPVIWISSLFSLLGIILILITATADPLRPRHCGNKSRSSSSPSPSCGGSPTKLQYAVVYAGLSLATIGVGGSRSTIGTMGANQFDNPTHQATFFNWYVFTLYAAATVSTTAIVYLEDNVSWGWGFAVCAAANLVGSVVFLLGNRFYRHVKPQGSPFTGLARVVVAAIRKRKVSWVSSGTTSTAGEDYYFHGQKVNGGVTMMVPAMPTKTFKFLNRAALITEGDLQAEDGSILKPWNLCTVQQVEDLKTLIRLTPLWSTGIFLSIPLSIQNNLALLQALTMNCQVGPHFKFPPATMAIFIMISASITITIVDRFLFPTWQKITGRFPPPLQRIGIGHVICFLSMGLSALVELRRLRVAQSHSLELRGEIVPMSVFWLVPQLALAGVGEAFHFPGSTALCYQEYPSSMKGLSTAMAAMSGAIANYLSTAFVGVVHRVTEWLPDNINQGRMDKMYWVLFVVGVVNFAYYVACAWFYKYRGVAEVEDGNSRSDH